MYTYDLTACTTDVLLQWNGRTSLSLTFPRQPRLKDGLNSHRLCATPCTPMVSFMSSTMGSHRLKRVQLPSIRGETLITAVSERSDRRHCGCPVLAGLRRGETTVRWEAKRNRPLSQLQASRVLGTHTAGAIDTCSNACAPSTSTTGSATKWRTITVGYSTPID